MANLNTDAAPLVPIAVSNKQRADAAIEREKRAFLTEMTTKMEKDGLYVWKTVVHSSNYIIWALADDGKATDCFRTASELNALDYMAGANIDVKTSGKDVALTVTVPRYNPETAASAAAAANPTLVQSMHAKASAEIKSQIDQFIQEVDAKMQAGYVHFKMPVSKKPLIWAQDSDNRATAFCDTIKALNAHPLMVGTTVSHRGYGVFSDNLILYIDVDGAVVEQKETVAAAARAAAPAAPGGPSTFYSDSVLDWCSRCECSRSTRCTCDSNHGSSWSR